jgi:hypothetical protein
VLREELAVLIFDRGPVEVQYMPGAKLDVLWLNN